MAEFKIPSQVIRLTTSFALIYTVTNPLSAPSNRNMFIVDMVHLCNVTGGPILFSICVVPSGGSPTDANALLWEFSVAANDVQEMLQGDKWESGSTIYAKASVNNSANIKLAGTLEF